MGYLPPLEAWLKKKHRRAGRYKKEWGRRWVHVNDDRGRLHIGKTQGGDGKTVVRVRALAPSKDTLFLIRPALTTPREPHHSPLTSRPLSSPPRGVSVQFSLSEVTEIRVLNPLDPESGGRMFSFMVIQAPLSVVLRCKDTTERKWWLAQLEKRVEMWRERRREEMAMMG